MLIDMSQINEKHCNLLFGSGLPQFILNGKFGETIKLNRIKRA